ncbi:unnamed protein product [Closterium sp. NIES-54]
MVTTTTPGGQHVSICTCTQTSRHLGMLTRRPGSSLYTLATEPPQIAASAKVSMSGPVAPLCSCRLLSHQTLLWHHRLGHPSLPRLRGMHSCLLVSGLPRSLPPLPPFPAPPCLHCVEGRQRAAPHSSSFPPTTAPQETLHMDVWGPGCVSGPGRERYFLLSVSSSASGSAKTFLSCVCTLTELVSSPLTSCRGEGILQSFTLPASPQQNGVAERRIGLVMELNLWPRVSLPETSPTMRWAGKVGDASVFRVRGSRAFVRDTFADKLSSCAIPCDVTFDESVPFFRLFPYRTAPLPPPPLFLAPGPPPVDPLPPQGPSPSGVSQVDPLSGTVPVKVAVDSGAARGATSGGDASGGAEPASAELGGAEPAGAEPGGAESWGADFGGAELGDAKPGGTELEVAEPGGTELEDAEPGGAESEGAESGGAAPRGTASAEGLAGSSPRLSPRREPLSPQQVREWFARCTRLRRGAAGAGGFAAGSTGAGGAGATSLGGAGVPAGAGGIGGDGVASPGGARTRGTGAAEAGGVGGARAGGDGVGDPGAKGARARCTGTGGAGAGGAGAGDPSATGAGAGGAGAFDPGAGGAGVGGAASSDTGSGGTVWRRPFFVPPPPSSLPPPDSILCQVLSLPSSTGLPPSSLSPPPQLSQPQSPYAEQTYSFTEHHEHESRPALPVRAVRSGRCVPRPRPPPIPSTHIMALRPSSLPLPTIPRLLAIVVTDPSFESTATSALVAELVDFDAACRLDYAASLAA